MKISRDYIYTLLKQLLLFALLMSATLLLLELPALFYKQADSELLLEQGMASYQLKSVNKNYILFSEKIKIFENSYVEYALGDIEVLTEAEVTEAETILASEMTELFGENYEPVTEALNRGEFESRGVVIPVMDYSKEQVQMWDIGILVFVCHERNWTGYTLYDYDSGKIIFLNCDAIGGWNFSKNETWKEPYDAYENENDKIYGSIEKVQEPESDDMARINAYYEGIEIVVEESNIFLGDYVQVSPLTVTEINESSLFWDPQHIIDLYNVDYEVEVQ